MRRIIYSICLTLLLPAALLHLLLRSRRQPEYLHHIGERFGRYLGGANTTPLIWIHAVSVGESRAAEPLIQALRRQYPRHRILLTHMTPTGRATHSPGLDSCERCYLPYDTPWGVAAFLRHYRPSIGLIMETELWPNLIAGCRKQQVPLLLVNARLSARSASRYERWPSLTRFALQGLYAIGAQSEQDAARLRKLGGERIEVCGNLKFDLELPPAQLAQAATWRAALGTRPVVLCASTREGEESLLLEAWQQIETDALLVIVPRHPQRFDAVAELVRKQGLSLQRRSQGLPDATARVWLGDSMGEMVAYYALADLAFIGGSLLDFGSQNLIEACAAGAPVLLGPSTYNFAEAAANALACGAAVSIRDATGFADETQRLLADASARGAMRTAGLAFAARHRGATQCTLALIESAMQAGGK